MIFLTAAVCCLVLVVVSGSIHWRTALSLFSDSSPIGLSETHDDGREGRREQRTSHRRAGTSSVVLQDEEEWRASRRKQPQQQLGSLDVDEDDATAELRILQKWNVLFQQEAMPLKHVKGQKSTTDVERIVSCEAKKAAAELRSDFERLQSSFGSRILDDHSLTSKALFHSHQRALLQHHVLSALCIIPAAPTTSGFLRRNETLSHSHTTATSLRTRCSVDGNAELRRRRSTSSWIAGYDFAAVNGSADTPLSVPSTNPAAFVDARSPGDFPGAAGVARGNGAGVDPKKDEGEGEEGLLRARRKRNRRDKGILKVRYRNEVGQAVELHFANALAPLLTAHTASFQSATAAARRQKDAVSEGSSSSSRREATPEPVPQEAVRWRVSFPSLTPASPKKGPLSPLQVLHFLEKQFHTNTMHTLIRVASIQAAVLQLRSLFPSRPVRVILVATDSTRFRVPLEKQQQQQEEGEGKAVQGNAGLVTAWKGRTLPSAMLLGFYALFAPLIDCEGGQRKRSISSHTPCVQLWLPHDLSPSPPPEVTSQRADDEGGVRNLGNAARSASSCPDDERNPPTLDGASLEWTVQCQPNVLHSYPYLSFFPSRHSRSRFYQNFSYFLTPDPERLPSSDGSQSSSVASDAHHWTRYSDYHVAVSALSHLRAQLIRSLVGENEEGTGREEKGSTTKQAADSLSAARRQQFTVTVIQRHSSRRILNLPHLYDALSAAYPQEEEEARRQARRSETPNGEILVRTVSMESLSFAERFRVMRDSDVVVGVHGAGLAWSLAMDGNGRGGGGAYLVEIVPASLQLQLRSSMFAPIASAAGVSVHCLFPVEGVVRERDAEGGSIGGGNSGGKKEGQDLRKNVTLQEGDIQDMVRLVSMFHKQWTIRQRRGEKVGAPSQGDEWRWRKGGLGPGQRGAGGSDEWKAPRKKGSTDSFSSSFLICQELSLQQSPNKP